MEALHAGIASTAVIGSERAINFRLFGIGIVAVLVPPQDRGRLKQRCSLWNDSVRRSRVPIRGAHRPREHVSVSVIVYRRCIRSREELQHRVRILRCKGRITRHELAQEQQWNPGDGTHRPLAALRNVRPPAELRAHDVVVTGDEHWHPRTPRSTRCRCRHRLVPQDRPSTQ